MVKLLEPLVIGAHVLPNRVFMAPLVRARSDDMRAPTELVDVYYSQRASAGLIITEGCHVSPQSTTRANASAHHTDHQTAAWKRVVDAVHAAGGTIFQQLYHVGRKALLSTMPTGVLPVAPSAIEAIGGVVTPEGLEAFPVPRALETHEIGPIVETFRASFRRAGKAGFDGVEVLAANGFLIDQFLRDETNHRTDAYGGSIENRARFLLEVVDAAIAELGASRVGVRVSPHFRSDRIGDSDPVGTFSYVATELDRRGIVYLHLLEGTTNDDDPFLPLYLRLVRKSSSANSGPGPIAGDPFLAPILRPLFKGTLILNGGYTRETAERVLTDGLADAVAFGRLYIANPDLPERFRRNAPLNQPDPSTFYSGGPRGYIDYPAMSEQALATFGVISDATAPA
ncbi:alkene reductase [Variovorax sp. J2P1-59]|uniref:alkene reductase n=1 Tax=Variovorax flavidus TaxID=3053501 RepID=UPI002576B6B0|nr:alkene reductase [Variovorax sp. J2P1-59]MDM0078124.1 alkene reductase [Variovorax sp. J2P1-59]